MAAWKKATVVVFAASAVAYGYSLAAAGVPRSGRRWRSSRAAGTAPSVACGRPSLRSGRYAFVYSTSGPFSSPAALLVRSGEAMYAFVFGAALVVFGMLLQDVVDGWYGVGDE